VSIGITIIGRYEQPPEHWGDGPFTPSWIDRFNDWVERLPIRNWIFHVVFGIVLVLIQLLFLWLDRGLQAEEIVPIVIFNAFAVPYLLALLHLLDEQAATSLDAMRPRLNLSETEYGQYEYRLSNMPFLAPLIAGLIVTLITVLAPLVATEPVRYAPLEQLPVFAVVFHIIDKSSAFLMGVFIYHTLRQLRLVDGINSNHIRVNLFDLRPLRAFSRLTASTAVGLLVFVYAWMLINPELLADPLLFGMIMALTILAITIFVWPLYGVHRLMEAEKEKALHDIDLRLEAAFSKFNERFQEDDFPAIEPLNATISSLEIQHARISGIPTWPWRSESARLVLTAVALPLILMIIQFFLLQAAGR
jgi:hypothetical protein